MRWLSPPPKKSVCRGLGPPGPYKIYKAIKICPK